MLTEVTTIFFYSVELLINNNCIDLNTITHTDLVAPDTSVHPSPSTNPFVYSFDHKLLNTNSAPGTVLEMGNGQITSLLSASYILIRGSEVHEGNF